MLDQLDPAIAPYVVAGCCAACFVLGGIVVHLASLVEPRRLAHFGELSIEDDGCAARARRAGRDLDPMADSFGDYPKVPQ